MALLKWWMGWGHFVVPQGSFYLWPTLLRFGTNSTPLSVLSFCHLPVHIYSSSTRTPLRVRQTCLLLAWIWRSTFSSSPSFLSSTVPFVLSDDLLNILMISTQDVIINCAHYISSLLLDTESPFSSTFCFIWSCDGLLLLITDQYFGFSHQLRSANMNFPLLFYCMPLLTSLCTPDIFLNILFLRAWMAAYGTNICWMLSGYIQSTTVLWR